MQLPTTYIPFITATYPPNLATQILSGLQTPPEVSVRLNGRKHPAEYPLLSSLFQDEVPWLPMSQKAYYLSGRPPFSLDPLWHSGAYYVQDASSMIVGYIVEQLQLPCNIPVRALDLCAAPGGKSQLLRDFLPKDSLLVCNEIELRRARILHENMLKWCATQDTLVTSAEPQALAKALGEYFDIILVDAPCSGEGLFRKDEQAVQMWSRENVSFCAQRQWQILEAADRLLQQDGFLLYSTCTLNKEENEAIVLRMIREKGYRVVSMVLPQTKYPHGIYESEEVGWHFFPHLVKGEGLYICVLQKGEGVERRSESQPLIKKKNKSGSAREDVWVSLTVSHSLMEAMEWLVPEVRENLYVYNDELYLISTSMQACIRQLLARKIYLLSYGVPLAACKGKKVQPLWPLAMSSDLLVSDTFLKKVDLTYPEALEYLRCQALVTNGGESGYVLMCYQGVALGFANRLSSRLNNLFPKEYRLRS
ncbi:MAG: rRNA cytosine-C5-methyltransferase [Porphyromonas sp.]|nr:rRNA cytosine-C5-methyltransferase [Porphyromonas sp.]